MVLASTVLVWAALAGVERGAGQDRPHGDVRIEEVVDHPHEDVRIEEVVHDATGSIARVTLVVLSGPVDLTGWTLGADGGVTLAFSRDDDRFACPEPFVLHEGERVVLELGGDPVCAGPARRPFVVGVAPEAAGARVDLVLRDATGKPRDVVVAHEVASVSPASADPTGPRRGRDPTPRCPRDAGGDCQKTVAIPILTQDIRSDFPTWAQHRQQPVSRLGFRNGGRYRSLGWIDLSSIPANAVIDGVVIGYWTTSGDPANVDPNGDVPNLGAPITVEVRRILRAWNYDEPLTYPASLQDNDTPAGPGETSWNHSLFPETWERAGVSGATDAGPVVAHGFVANAPDTRVEIAGPGLAALVQSWLEDPQGNHGFLLRGIEADESPEDPNRKILCGKGFPLETSTGLDPATAAAHRPRAWITYRR